METILLALVIGTLCTACFLIGATVGFRVQKGETPVEAPKNPVDALTERKDKRQARAEKERIDTILRNIDNYDGSGLGQEEVRG